MSRPAHCGFSGCRGSCPDCLDHEQRTGDPLEDAYREWLERQSPETQRRMRQAMEPDWQAIHEDREEARAERRRAREER